MNKGILRKGRKRSLQEDIAGRILYAQIVGALR